MGVETGTGVADNNREVIDRPDPPRGGGSHPEIGTIDIDNGSTRPSTAHTVVRVPGGDTVVETAPPARVGILYSGKEEPITTYVAYAVPDVQVDLSAGGSEPVPDAAGTDSATLNTEDVNEGATPDGPTKDFGGGATDGATPVEQGSTKTSTTDAPTVEVSSDLHSDGSSADASDGKNPVDSAPADTDPASDEVVGDGREQGGTERDRERSSVTAEDDGSTQEPGDVAGEGEVSAEGDGELDDGASVRGEVGSEDDSVDPVIEAEADESDGTEGDDGGGEGEVSDERDGRDQDGAAEEGSTPVPDEPEAGAGAAGGGAGDPPDETAQPPADDGEEPSDPFADFEKEFVKDSDGDSPSEPVVPTDTVRRPDGEPITDPGIMAKAIANTGTTLGLLDEVVAQIDEIPDPGERLQLLINNAEVRASIGLGPDFDFEGAVVKCAIEELGIDPTDTDPDTRSKVEVGVDIALMHARSFSDTDGTPTAIYSIREKIADATVQGSTADWISLNERLAMSLIQTGRFSEAAEVMETTRHMVENTGGVARDSYELDRILGIRASSLLLYINKQREVAGSDAIFYMPDTVQEVHREVVTELSERKGALGSDGGKLFINLASNYTEAGLPGLAFETVSALPDGSDKEQLYPSIAKGLAQQGDTDRLAALQANIEEMYRGTTEPESRNLHQSLKEKVNGAIVEGILIGQEGESQKAIITAEGTIIRQRDRDALEKVESFTDIGSRREGIIALYKYNNNFVIRDEAAKLIPTLPLQEQVRTLTAISAHLLQDDKMTADNVHVMVQIGNCIRALKSDQKTNGTNHKTEIASLRAARNSLETAGTQKESRLRRLLDRGRWGGPSKDVPKVPVTEWARRGTVRLVSGREQLDAMRGQVRDAADISLEEKASLLHAIAQRQSELGIVNTDTFADFTQVIRAGDNPSERVHGLTDIAVSYAPVSARVDDVRNLNENTRAAVAAVSPIAAGVVNKLRTE